MPERCYRTCTDSGGGLRGKQYYIIFGGSNYENDSYYMDQVLEQFGEGDLLILQKSNKEGHEIRYNTFGEIAADLQLDRISMKDALFLKKRKAKLREYENVKKANLNGVFASNEKKNAPEGNLEEKFGFEATVVLSDAVDSKDSMSSKNTM